MMVYAMGLPPLVWPSCPHSYPPLFPILSCPCASRALWSPGGPFPAKAPSHWGEANSHLTKGICPFILLAKNKLFSGMYGTGICPLTAPSPDYQGFLFSQLYENGMGEEGEEQNGGKCESIVILRGKDCSSDCRSRDFMHICMVRMRCVLRLCVLSHFCFRDYMLGSLVYACLFEVIYLSRDCVPSVCLPSHMC